MAIFSAIGNAIFGGGNSGPSAAQLAEQQRQAEEDRRMAKELTEMREKELALQEKFMDKVMSIVDGQGNSGQAASGYGHHQAGQTGCGGGHPAHGQHPGNAQGCGAATPPPTQSGCGHAHPVHADAGNNISQSQIDNLKELREELDELSAQNGKLAEELDDAREERQQRFDARLDSSGEPRGLLAFSPLAHMLYAGLKFS